MEMTEENTRKKTKKFALSIRRGYIGLVLSQVVKGSERRHDVSSRS